MEYNPLEILARPAPSHAATDGFACHDHFGPAHVSSNMFTPSAFLCLRPLHGNRCSHRHQRCPSPEDLESH